MLTDPERVAALERTGLLDAGPAESFDRLSMLAARLLRAPVALVSLVDRDRQYFTSCIGLEGLAADQRQTPLSHSICQYALATDGPLVIPDTTTDPRLVENRAPTELGVRAYLGIPLVDRDGHVLGSFCVADRVRRQWSEADVEIMTGLAGSVMAEIRLHEAALDLDRLAATAARTAATTRQVLDRLPILAALLENDGSIVEVNQPALDAAGVSHDDMVGLPFWDSPWWQLTGTEQGRLRHAVEQAASGTATRLELQVDDHGEARMMDVSLAPLLDGSGAAVGLVASGFDITDQRNVQDELARLAVTEQRQRQRAERMGRLAEALAGATTVEEVAIAITDHAGAVVGAVFANLAVVTPDHNLALRHGPGLDAEVGERWPRVPIDHHTPLGYAVLTNQPVVLSNPEAIRTRFPLGADDAEQAGLLALAAVPAVRSQAAVGFAWNEPLASESRVTDLAVVAELCDRALARARSHEHEREIAHRLQRSFLPSYLPRLAGLELAARYEAGAPGMEVGGDWYDAIGLDDHRLLLIIGDVVGHGLPAATAMGQLRHACSALAAATSDVADLVSQLDQLALDIDEARMATMVAATLDLATGQLDIVSAGHPPAMIRRRDGKVELATGRNLPLGIQAGVQRHVDRLTLGPGEVLLLYTDGLIERRGEPLDVSLNLLAEVLAAAQPSTADELADHLFLHFTPDRVDDVALLVVQL